MRLDQEQKRRSCCIPKSPLPYRQEGGGTDLTFVYVYTSRLCAALAVLTYTVSRIQLHNNVCPHVQTHW